ncbi:hypothetical protein BXO88_14805 [Oribacterium sp. C9]|uniref:GTP pyrophosphokinase n=1 Tax=Oribacterium sp. C9 TaxID=1943579 RepID=UPI0009CFFE5F|nr:GTP pyrophosphokinase [Oribacterium sp. C9]OON84936.1 hypothetical protein BXO88_14805 [Oribacterium sp. C9]
MSTTKNSNQKINELLEKYSALAPIIDERIRSALSGINHSALYDITHRIKTVKSIKGKMERKPDKYHDASELRDILGFRIICFFEEDIDVIAEKIAGAFRVDRKHSKDKRSLIDPTSFGYLSLHYIIALPDDEAFPEELRHLWFEVQIRTILQHVWAEIEHDLGYKSEFGTPREVRRNFSKAASLLETADDLFSNIKKRLVDYKKEVIRSIENDQAENLYLDAITITEFTSRSRTYQNFLREIASITGATINDANPESQLAQLDFLGIHTLGALVEMIDREHDTALRIAQEKLSDSGLEELSSTVPYYYLYRAVLINNGCSPERIKEFLSLTLRDENNIERNAQWILDARSEQQR